MGSFKTYVDKMRWVGGLKMPIFVHFLGEKCPRQGRSVSTVPIPKIISAKNARAWASMNFIQHKYSAPIAIEKIKILGAL